MAMSQYTEKDVRKAMQQMEARRQYMHSYFQSPRGKLVQRLSRVKTTLQLAKFDEAEIESILERIKAAAADRAGGENGGGVE